MARVQSRLKRLEQQMKPKREKSLVISWEELENNPEAKPHWEYVDPTKSISWDDLEED